MKKKLILGLLLFAILPAGMGGFLIQSVRREEALFHSVGRLIQARQVLREMEYFIRRYDRALLSYVMLRDDAEKLQVHQAQKALSERLEQWTAWIESGEGSAEDLAAVKEKCQEMAFLRFQIMSLAEEGGRRREAIDKTNAAFLPASTQALERLKSAATRADARNHLLANDLSAVTHLSRQVMAGGVTLAILLLLLMVWTFHDVMILSVVSASPAPRMTRPADGPILSGRGGLLTKA